MAGINGAKPGGKGAFTYGAGKKMSCSHPDLKTAGMTKMSGKHGTTGQSKSNNMNQTTGGSMIGSDCRTFRKAPYASASGDAIGGVRADKGSATAHSTKRGVQKD